MKSVPGAREGSEEEGTELGETVCPCGKVYEETGVFMIQCDICRDWLHGECVRVTFLQLDPNHESSFVLVDCKPNKCVLSTTMSL